MADALDRKPPTNERDNPRFALFAHLVDVHGWKLLAAFQFSEAAAPSCPCPKCGRTDYKAS